MKTSYCLCISIKGALRNWNARQWVGVATDTDTGRVLTPQEFKEHLLDELAKGHKVVPCGPCDNFDYEHGCMGHPIPDELPEAQNAG